MMLFPVCALLLSALSLTVSASVSSTTCNGKTYTYDSLAGFGSIPGSFRDKYGDTLSFGSSVAVDRPTWKKNRDGSYSGTLWMLPDRGWNTNGTTNYQPRVHKFDISFAPLKAGAKSPAPQNLVFKYRDTVLLTDFAGTPTTGLDANTVLKFKGWPDLPAAKYTGDGFGGSGPGGIRVSLDTEGIVLGADGSLWISDEYGPYIYRFTQSGKMIEAIAPPGALIPQRNGTESFSADSPPIYAPGTDPIPATPTSGRSNNQGLEGLAASPSRNTLYALLQSATIQDGGAITSARRWTRFFKYAIARGKHVYEDAWAVGLPTYLNAANATRVAAQSEAHYLDGEQFFVLARDSSAGRGQASTLSLYRHIDVFDISKASSIHMPQYDAVGAAIAPNGTLSKAITPALYCPFLDFNNNMELAKFGLHNGGAQDVNLLNEKWEGMVVLPIDGDGEDGWYYIIATSDNDFVTQNGYINFGKIQYKDGTGLDYPNEALVFKVQLPKGSKPF